MRIERCALGACLLLALPMLAAGAADGAKAAAAPQDGAAPTK